MEVLEQGNSHIEVPKKITCGNCASILEYIKTDVMQASDTLYDPRDREPYEVKTSVIICPVCKNYIKI